MIYFISNIIWHIQNDNTIFVRFGKDALSYKFRIAIAYTLEDMPL